MQQTGMVRRAANKNTPSADFETYLRFWADRIGNESNNLRKLTELAVTMHVRFRGLTISEMCGRYGSRRETDGRWLPYDAELDGEIHPINIVQPAIRANTNACLQSNASINVESTNASAKHQQISGRWQQVNDYWERKTWSGGERTYLFDALQKTGTVLIDNFTENSEEYDVPSVSKSGYMAAFKCSECEEQGHSAISEEDFANYPEEEGEQDIDCPSCGGAAKGAIQRMDGFDLSEEKGGKEIKTRIVPFFNFVIDSYNSRIEGVPGAKWLCIQSITARPELETKHPQHAFGSPQTWSYQLQCDYAIASSDWRYLNGRWNGGSTVSQDFDEFATYRIYLHEEVYSNYRFPSEFEYVNGAGKKVISAKTGQTIGEAWKSQYGENPKGFAFEWCDDRLIDIISPEDEEINFRERFDAVHWLKDSSGFHSSPFSSIVQIQDDITLLNTMNHLIIAQNAVQPVLYNSRAVSPGDWGKQFIPTKNSALFEDIRDVAMALPAPTPSPYLSNQLQFLWEIKDSVSQVQPALRGEQQKGETYGAQRQQLEQSYGLLTSALQSFAMAKVSSFKKKAKIAAKHWTLEQFNEVASHHGEKWTDQDVKEMSSIDFDKDLIVDYIQGSEMPSGNLEREMRFNAGLQQVMGLAQAGVQMAPDKLEKIMQKIDEFADFDFDVSGLETAEMISQKRIQEIRSICEMFGAVDLEAVEMLKNSVATMDEMGQPVSQLDLMLEQAFYQTTIRFNEYEDLEQQGREFIQAMAEETGKTSPNYFFIEMCQTVLGIMQEAIQIAQQEAIESDPMVQEAKRQEQLTAEAAQVERDQKVQDDAAKHEMDLEKEQMKHAAQLQLAEASKEEEAEKVDA